MAAPTIPYTIPGTVDQDRPEMVCRLSFSGARTSSPTWVDVSDRVRAFNIDRGGENELDLIDTGTATVVLDNRDRALDPFNTSSPYSPNVKPRRRLWLQSQWDGQTIDRFYGWTGAFKPEWPGGGTDAVVNLAAQDGFAILAGDALPTTSPPRDSFRDVILSDKPTLYFELDEPAGAEVADSSEQSIAGTYIGTVTRLQPSLVVGDATGFSVQADGVSENNYISADGRGRGGLSNLTIEMLVRLVDAGTVLNYQNLCIGPVANVAGATACYGLSMSTGGIQFTTTQTDNSQTSAQWTNVFNIGQAYYVQAVWNGTTVKVYVDGVERASGTPAAPMAAATGTRLRFGWTNNLDPPLLNLDEIQLYENVPLSTNRLTAHYNAALLRGRDQELANDRIAALLEESGLSFVPRRLRTAAREVQPTYYIGQPPKTEIEEANKAEGDPAMFFFAGDGAAVFLDRNHRTAFPWNTVQATFDDDGTDLPYRALEIDDGEAFIYNDVRVTARGGELQQSTDTASIDEYQRRVLDRGETLNVSDADADAEGDALLAKYKDPLARITALELTGGEPAVLTAMLAREIGDRIRVFRRPVGGGSAIDQTSFIRKISLSGSAEDPYWTCVWSVSSR